MHIAYLAGANATIQNTPQAATFLTYRGNQGGHEIGTHELEKDW